MTNHANESQADRAKLEERLSAAAWKEAMSVLTLGFMHDLNNVLTGILGLADTMLLDAKPGAGARESLTLIKRSTQQAAGLVEQLARLHGAKTAERTYHDLNCVVRQALEILRRAVPKCIRFESSLWPDTLPVLADAHELQRAVVGVVLVAARAISGSGTLVVQTSREESPREGPPKLAAPQTPVGILTIKPDSHGSSFGGGTGAFTAQGQPDGDTLLDLCQVGRWVEKCGGTLVRESAAPSGTAIRLCLPLENVGEPDTPSSGVKAGNP